MGRTPCTVLFCFISHDVDEFRIAPGSNKHIWKVMHAIKDRKMI